MFGHFFEEKKKGKGQLEPSGNPGGAFPPCIIAWGHEFENKQNKQTKQKGEIWWFLSIDELQWIGGSNSIYEKKVMDMGLSST